jgi:lysophospholipase L1-like esterase
VQNRPNKLSRCAHTSARLLAFHTAAIPFLTSALRLSVFYFLLSAFCFPVAAAPAVSLTSPLPGAFCHETGRATLVAHVTDSNAPPTGATTVEFFAGATSLGLRTNPPFTLIWTNPPPGLHLLTAVATGHQGTTATSAPVRLQVLTNGAPIRIMPLGDSITDGYFVPGSYRIELRERLTNAAVPVDFVGSSASGPFYIEDKQHEGHPGYQISQLMDGIAHQGWLNTYQPDVVLLLAGANDVNGNLPGALDRLSALIEQIFTNRPNAHVVVGALPPNLHPDAQARVLAFNAALPGLVAQKAAAGRAVTFCDDYLGFQFDEFVDHLHPNPAGFTRMAESWFGALMPVLTAGAPPAIAITSPTNGHTFAAPANLTLTTAVSDPDGAVTRVEFFLDQFKVGEATSAPFSFTCTNLTSGRFKLSARAWDASGASATSQTIEVRDNLEFVFGVNFGAGAAPVTINGYPWLGQAAAQTAGLILSNAQNFATPSYWFPVSPPRDLDEIEMLKAGLFASPVQNGQGFSLRKAVPNGYYSVYLWFLEDSMSNFRDMEVRLEGASAATGLGDLPIGQWRKYGPFTAPVSDGELNIDVLRATKGEPAISGLAVFRFNGPNSAPSLSAIADQAVDEDAPLGPLAFTLEDAETPAENLTVNVACSNPALFPPGRITLGGTGTNRTLTLLPATNTSGTAVITLTATDGIAATNRSFTVTVHPVNDPPVADSQSLIRAGSSPAAITLTGSDVESTNLDFLIVAPPLHGTLSGTPPQVIYTPDANYAGPDSFQFVVSDGALTSSVATVSLGLSTFLRGVNVGGPAVVIEGDSWLSHDAALASGLSVGPTLTFNNGGPYYFALTPVPDAGTEVMLRSAIFSFASIGQGFNLSQTISNGSYHVFVWLMENYSDYYRKINVRLEGATVATNAGFLPRGAWQKLGPFPVEISDGALNLEIIRADGGEPTLFGFAIYGAAPPNTPPVAMNLALTNAANHDLSGFLRGSDAETTNLVFSVVSSPAHGVLTGFDSATGAFDYRPVHGFTGADSFTYRASDGALESIPATVNLWIAPEPDSDGDGIPDAWEVARGLNPLVHEAEADPDGDGLSNRQEYLADTDPLSPTSGLKPPTVTMDAQGRFTLSWPSVGGVRYRVQFSDGTATGQFNGSFTDVVRPLSVELDPAPAGTASVRQFLDDFTLTPPPAGGRRYYRIKVIH